MKNRLKFHTYDKYPIMLLLQLALIGSYYSLEKAHYEEILLSSLEQASML